MTAPLTERPTWGPGVYALRTTLGLSQVQLAEKAGTFQPTISLIEKGRRRGTDELRVRIAKALNVDPNALFPYEEAP